MSASDKQQKGSRSGAAAGRNRAEESDRAGRGGVVAENGARDQIGQGMSQTMIDLEFLRGLIEAIDQSGIDSLELSRAGTRIRISKSAPQSLVAQAPIAQASSPAALPAALHAAGVAQAAQPPAAPAEAAPAAAPKSDLYEVKSPMVGTFYRAPAPEAPAYAEVGSQITKGQTLCILEAMKLMNELESEVDGVVREILVDNAEPVEYGQVLFRVELK